MEHRMTGEKLVKAGIYLVATLIVATALTVVVLSWGAPVSILPN